MEAVLAGLNLAVEDARKAYMATGSPMEFQDLRTAQRLCRRETLSFKGVDCPPCEGSGDTVTGTMPADLFSQAEPIYQPCPTCSGEGRLLPTERVRWLARHPEHELNQEDF